jgi:hypothetical protein
MDVDSDRFFFEKPHTTSSSSKDSSMTPAWGLSFLAPLLILVLASGFVLVASGFLAAAVCSGAFFSSLHLPTNVQRNKLNEQRDEDGTYIPSTSSPPHYWGL